MSKTKEIIDEVINSIQIEQDVEEIVETVLPVEEIVQVAMEEAIQFQEEIQEAILDILEEKANNDEQIIEEEKAIEGALDLFTVQEQCPVDLLKYLENSGRLPDAQIKSELGQEHGKKLLHENWDFIARLFLESYYREE